MRWARSGGFAFLRGGKSNGMSDSPTRPTRDPNGRVPSGPRPVLFFFYTATSGPSRRMESIVSWLWVRERKRFRLRMVDANANPDLVTKFEVDEIPTIVLVEEGKILTRREGRLTSDQLDQAILPYLHR
jgi:thioredoxin-like negative regulator of GroEL